LCLRGLPGLLGDSDWTGDGAHRDLTFDSLLDELKNQHRAFFIFLERAIESIRWRQFADLCLWRVLETDAVALFSRAVRASICQHGLDGKVERFTIAHYCELHRLVFTLLQTLDHGVDGRQGLAIHSNYLVAFFNAGFRRRHLWFKIADYHRFVGIPSRRPHLIAGHRHRHDLFLNIFPVAQHSDIQRLVRAKHHLEINLLPCGILNSINPDDAISRLYSSLSR